MRARQGSKIGEYILLDKLGEGGFGEVWKARHNFFKDKIAAIKIPRDETYIKTLKTEGIIEHQLDNPHIVRILGFDAGHDPPYMVMEYVEGKSLRQLLKEKGKLPVKDALNVFEQLLDVLEYAHGEGVIHRDIKPENILIQPDETVKLTDFGLGLVSEKAKGSLLFSGSLTSTGKSIAGTAEYMSPEQRAGKNVDQRADIYSLGIVLFEMLTGELPAGRDLPSGLNHLVPKYIDYIYSKCYTRLAKRFRSIEEIKERLTQKGQQQQAVSRKPAAMERDVDNKSRVLSHRKNAPPSPSSDGKKNTHSLVAVIMICLGTVGITALVDILSQNHRLSPPEITESAHSHLKGKNEDPLQKLERTLYEYASDAEKALLDRRYDDAIKSVQETLKHEPNNAEMYYTMGVAKFNKGDLDGAIKDFGRVIELNPKDLLVYSIRGSAREAKGDYEGAIQDYTKAIEIELDQTQETLFLSAKYVKRGLARSHKGDLDGAIADYTKAIELDPEYAATYFNRGVARKKKGNLEEAEADFAKARELGYEPK